MLIVDEVQSGFGRTGSYFAIEESGVRPDILVMAKVNFFFFFCCHVVSLMGCYDQGLGNGFPISGVVSRTEVTSQLKPGSMVGCLFLFSISISLTVAFCI